MSVDAPPLLSHRGTYSAAARCSSLLTRRLPTPCNCRCAAGREGIQGRVGTFIVSVCVRSTPLYHHQKMADRHHSISPSLKSYLLLPISRRVAHKHHSTPPHPPSRPSDPPFLFITRCRRARASRRSCQTHNAHTHTC